ncbi:hypothetical protein [uncultured Flavobacterium sp.]|uniref:hypothetical protein n=1 Tax=uncultured Flavobacterium sp. TaxID=165435 RepID=UPI0030C7DB60
MKAKTIFSLFLMLFAYVMQAQSNEVEIYTEDSKLFTVYVDGVKINENPLSNVRFTSTKSNNLDFKIVFAENQKTLEKKAVEMISSTNRMSFTNGAKAVYLLKPNSTGYELIQTTITNRPNANQKVID